MPSDHLTAPPAHRAAGAAFYQQAELHRLRGEFEQAEQAYRQASQWGRSPQPGLALMRLMEGRIDAAAGAMRRLMEESRGRIARARLLGAHAEIMLAEGDAEAARAAADELSEIASAMGAPYSRRAPPDGAARCCSPAGLTARELDVLRLVATGRTNRAVADDLYISEKTVARHLSNIFGKLGVSSRAAATAFAYQHGLIETSA